MHSENILMLKAAFALAGKVSADSVVVHVDPLEDLDYTERIPKKIKLILVGRKRRPEISEEVGNSLVRRSQDFIQLPKISLTRISLIKIAATIALSREMVAADSKMVFAVGHQETGPLDLLHILNLAQESEIIAGRGLIKIGSVIRPELFQSVLNLAIEIADKGREGKPIGTIFVLGDHERVLQLSKQMILNPFRGYDETERNILAGSLKETIREFSAMDGAFIISEEGIILTAGRYLGAAMDDTLLPRGLGSRHIAAAGITKMTKALALVISESSGDIRLFKDGKIVMHIEKAPSR